jgi:hypothetical protein
MPDVQIDPTLELAKQMCDDDPSLKFSDAVNTAVVLLREEKTDDARLLRDARDLHARSNGIDLPGLEERSADPAVTWMRDARGGICVDIMATARKLSEKSPGTPYSDHVNRAAVLARDLRPDATRGRGPVESPLLVTKQILIDRGIVDSDAANVAYHLSDRRIAVEAVDIDQLRDRLAAGDTIRVALVAAMLPHERQVAMRAGR